LLLLFMENIILLHGALGSSSDLETLSGKLKQKGTEVFSFSFSGHGKTNFQNAFGITRFSQELESFINHHHLKEPNIFGYSMGGYIALHLASNCPGLIGKIITLGTKFVWNEDSVAKEIKQLNAETIMQKVPAFAKLLREKHGPDWRHLLEKTGDMMKEISSSQPLTMEKLKRINTPTLFGIADRDQMVSVEETITVLKTLPAAFMFMLPNGKHQLESINLNLLSEIIFDFITG